MLQFLCDCLPELSVSRCCVEKNYAVNLRFETAVSCDAEELDNEVVILGHSLVAFGNISKEEKSNLEPLQWLQSC